MRGKLGIPLTIIRAAPMNDEAAGEGLAATPASAVPSPVALGST